MRDSRPSVVLQGLVAFAAVVVAVAGLKAASDIILPILFAAFLAILGVPLVRLLHVRLKFPSALAIFVVVLFFALGLVAITGIVVETVRSFTVNADRYQDEFIGLVGDTIRLADQAGIRLDESLALKILQPELMMGVISQTLNALIGVLSRLMIVLVTMTFILLEAAELELKFKAAFGTEARPAGPFTDATAQVQRYLVIKSIASAVTGLLITAGCTVIGLDFPVVWGLIAFLFNYVPSIGSIVAAIPAILLAVVQLSPAWGLAVMALYLAVNITIGNFLEPRFMGRQLGLSPLVVFLSLLFWGWVWGPVGMLFCVPMTVIAKLFLESQEDTRWIAVFLGSPRDILDQTQPG